MIKNGLSGTSSGYTVSVQCFFPFVNNRQAQTGALVPFHLPTIHGSGSHPFPLSISLFFPLIHKSRRIVRRLCIVLPVVSALRNYAFALFSNSTMA